MVWCVSNLSSSTSESSGVFDSFSIVGACLSPFYCFHLLFCSYHPGHLAKQHWIISERTCRQSSVIFTRCFYGATSFPCSPSMMRRKLNLRKVRLGRPQHILRLKSNRASLPHIVETAVRRRFRSLGWTEAPTHRCQHVRGPELIRRGRCQCRRSCKSKGECGTCGGLYARNNGVDTCQLHQADIREGPVAAHNANIDAEMGPSKP